MEVIAVRLLRIPCGQWDTRAFIPFKADSELAQAFRKAAPYPSNPTRCHAPALNASVLAPGRTKKAIVGDTILTRPSAENAHNAQRKKRQDAARHISCLRARPSVAPRRGRALLRRADDRRIARARLRHGPGHPLSHSSRPGRERLSEERTGTSGR